jgi:hypothetical protein
MSGQKRHWPLQLCSGLMQGHQLDVETIFRRERRRLSRQLPRLLYAGLDKQRHVPIGHQHRILAPDLGHEGIEAVKDMAALTVLDLDKSGCFLRTILVLRLAINGGGDGGYGKRGWPI